MLLKALLWQQRGKGAGREGEKWGGTMGRLWQLCRSWLAQCPIQLPSNMLSCTAEATEDQGVAQVPEQIKIPSINASWRSRRCSQLSKVSCGHWLFWSSSPGSDTSKVVTGGSFTGFVIPESHLRSTVPVLAPWFATFLTVVEKQFPWWAHSVVLLWKLFLEAYLRVFQSI